MKAVPEITKLQIEITDLLEIQVDIDMDIARLTRAKLKCDPSVLESFENTIKRMRDSHNDIADQISEKMEKINKLLRSEVNKNGN